MVRPGKKLLPVIPKLPALLFPVPLNSEFIELAHKIVKNPIYWIPDLQEKILPLFFFGQEEKKERTDFQKEVAYKRKYVVFSSLDAQKTFNKYFPDSLVNQFVIPFTVTHPDFNRLSGEMVLEEIWFARKLFFSPNQFWIHKNHMVILEALKIAKGEGVELVVVFSGKEYDHRSSEYFESLVEYVKFNGIENNVYFLGFIDRSEQLKLMSMSIAIIQPSKSEGWSTVIEDAKAMNKFVIASAIPVHMEQISQNCIFFEPENSAALSDNLITVARNKPRLIGHNYEIEVKKFAERFLNMTKSL